jgi:hypothetical protein
MKTRLLIPMLLVAWVGVACGGDGSRRDQQEYETVEEGSAAGVTSTIHGPGEVLPPITNTNADTTTAFTIDPNAVATAPAVGTAPKPEPAPAPSPSRRPRRPTRRAGRRGTAAATTDHHGHARAIDDRTYGTNRTNR